MKLDDDADVWCQILDGSCPHYVRLVLLILILCISIREDEDRIGTLHLQSTRTKGDFNAKGWRELGPKWSLKLYTVLQGLKFPSDKFRVQLVLSVRV